MTSQQSPQSGMEVVTNDGAVLGQVKDVSGTAKWFRVDCRHAPDLYIPHNYIQGIQDGHLVLRAGKHQMAYLGWELRPESY